MRRRGGEAARQPGSPPAILPTRCKDQGVFYMVMEKSFCRIQLGRGTGAGSGIGIGRRNRTGADAVASTCTSIDGLVSIFEMVTVVVVVCWCLWSFSLSLVV